MTNHQTTMIQQILRKEYDQMMRSRRHYKTIKGQGILFKADNGKYYKQDRVDMIGLKEIQEFKDLIKSEQKEQIHLL